jgi:hypothetical protein
MKIVVNDMFHEALKSFISVTSEMIQKGELGRLKDSFNLIDRLVSSGEPEVKELIRSVYIPSLYVLLDENEWKEPIISLFPHFLKEEYNRHVIHFRMEGDTFVFIFHLN